ncbi:MAG: arsenite methyltransferase [Candidatus Latescibacteria bacterium]|nr:arsenite methyltransferase [Candidatus Latescibacterota bacterium]NIM21979.1 arsenite methyltransferase [Candidatus Latescibacterota bacterium]NIM65997.1 arsenite methyltransferase [Candidatus Latescibacterota bacterium]NIO02405.1 arsenite methyltransferase [Candidatus Latescibacterota bacterium]NIO29315.1 arsenite methyltransferase [Candidatus Latescibacterota bacterium]
MKKDIKKIVKERYGEAARREVGCCGPVNSCVCGPELDSSRYIGYTSEEIRSAPNGANLGLGCGNPTAIASLRPGEIVLDLGSGAGFDCFLAAKKVLPGGKVYGLDMTPEMIARAKRNATKGGYGNVEFLLGDIEEIPLPDDSVDVVISNCVINLSPDKAIVFRESYRVLKPGGRLMISDLVLSKEIPDSVRNNERAYVGCIAGALLKDSYISLIEEAGFGQIEIMNEKNFPLNWFTNDQTVQTMIGDETITLDDVKATNAAVLSVSIAARKG